MIKIIINYTFIFFLVFFFENSKASEDNKIVIKVNDKIITSYEVKNKINTELVLRNLEINQSNINNIKNLAVKNLIDLRIKEGEIKKYNSIKLNNIDISRQLNSISSGNSQLIEKKFSDYNLNYEIFLKELRLQVAWQNLILILFQDKVKINENEILAEISRLKNESSNIKTYDLSEIEISFKNEKEKQEKLKKIKKSINNVGFNQTVAIYSESSSATNNGELGFLTEESLSEDIYNKLKNLKKGDISDPIIQPNKITLLKINEIKTLKNQKFNIEQAKKNLINKKKNNLFNLYSQSHLSKLKNSSFIEFK
tara:strand:- start:291 stop:1223 length:933 start_codon:yes stop_codon:yes gene_type:complete